MCFLRLLDPLADQRHTIENVDRYSLLILAACFQKVAANNKLDMKTITLENDRKISFLSDKLGIKKIGQWVNGNSHKSSPLILSVSARNAYYAGGKHVQMTSLNDILTALRAKSVDYILITHKEYKAIEKELLQFIKDKKVKLAYKYPEEKSLNRRSMLLYKVLY